MQSSHQIARSIAYFYRHKPSKLLALSLLTLFLGVNQGVSIVMLIPLLSLLDKGKASVPAEQGKVVDWMNSLASQAGVGLTIEIILALFITILVCISLLTYVKSRVQSSYEQEFTYSTRSRLYKKIITCDWAILTSKSKHSHIQVLSSEIPKLVTYYYALVNLATSAILISAHIVLALLISVKFTLLVLAVGVMVFMLMRRFMKRSLSLGGLNIGLFRKMLKQVDDFWVLVKQAKVHSSERFYFDQYDSSNRAMLSLQQKQNRNRATSQLLFTVAGVAGLVLIIYVGYRIDHLSMTSIFVLILLFARIFPLFISANGYIDIVASNLQSVCMVISMDEELVDNGFASATPSGTFDGKGNLRLSDICFSYDGKRAIFDSFSEEFAANQITGVLGQSGSGKTTLIDIIAGLIKPASGSVEIGETRLSADNAAIWKSMIGYLPQDSFFVDGTIRDNLVWDSPHHITDEQIIDMLRKVSADELVKREPLGLYSPIANYQFHFSGGERQRLALTRVLLRYPKLLLLDEATSALDSDTERQIMKSIMALKSELTIVFVTHRQSLVPYFDKVVYVKQNAYSSTM